MRKTACVIALIPLVFSAVCEPVFAARVKHRPWMMSKRDRPADAPAVPADIRSASSPAPAPALVPAAASSAKARPAARVSSDPGVKIAKRAMDYRGTRYKFGGTTKKGMDCSGLVARIFTDLKMRRVPRVSAGLYQSGRPVHMAELRPGDLVFFKNTYKRGISHVGVYAGNNKFVHAANKKRGVTVTSMADPYYQIHFAGARRLY